jgi:hypothetical protein
MVEDGCDRYLVSDVTCVLTRCTRKAGSGEGQRRHGFSIYFIQARAEVVWWPDFRCNLRREVSSKRIF